MSNNKKTTITKKQYSTRTKNTKINKFKESFRLTTYSGLSCTLHNG